MLDSADEDDRQLLLTTQAGGGQKHINTLEALHCDRYFNRSICLVLEEDNGKENGLERWVGVCYARRVKKTLEAEEYYRDTRWQELGRGCTGLRYEMSVR